MSKFRFQCSHCGEKCKVSKPGTYPCPRCHQALVVRPEDFAATTLSETLSNPEFAPSALPTSGIEQLAEAVSAALPASAGADQSDHATRRSLLARLPFVAKLSRGKQALLVGGATFLLVVVVGLLMRDGGDSSHNEDGGSGRTAATEGASKSETSPATKDATPSTATSNQPADPARPVVAVTPSKRRDAPLFDSDVVPGTSKPTRPKIGVGGLSQPSLTTGGKSAARGSTWADPAWSVSLEAGLAPVLDGVAVLTELAEPSVRTWPLVLPPGEHVWQSAADAEPQTRRVVRGFRQHYSEEKATLQSNGQYDFEKLARRTKPLAAAFNEPLLPHLWGNYFWQEKEFEAAVRFWRQAVRIEPSFAPAHLNLAFAFEQQKDIPAALRELALAAHGNPLDGYGVAAHVSDMRDRLGVWRSIETAPTWQPLAYQPTATVLSGEPRQVVQTLRTIADYAVKSTDRVKALNNAGVYLTHRSQPQHALEPLQQALRLLVEDGTLKSEPQLVQTLFENLERAARDAGMAEHALYGWLRKEWP